MSRTECRDRWRALVASWRASGLSKKQFCAEQQLSYYTFLRWTQRFEGKRDPSAGFVDVGAVSRQPDSVRRTEEEQSGTIEIHVAGAVVRVRSPIDPVTLETVLHALEHRQC